MEAARAKKEIITQQEQAIQARLKVYKRALLYGTLQHTKYTLSYVHVTC